MRVPAKDQILLLRRSGYGAAFLLLYSMVSAGCVYAQNNTEQGNAVQGNVVQNNVAAMLPGSIHLNQLIDKARQGYLKEELMVAADYYAGRGVERDFTQSAYWYTKAAQQGNPEAQVQVGYLYSVGLGVPRDAHQAADWYQRAAAAGSAAGKRNLGVLYIQGAGVRRDVAFGVQLIREAAAKGDEHAEAYLGHVYYFGMEVPIDHQEGEKWWIRAAKHQSAEAQYDLGTLLSVDPAHAHDLAAAARFLRLSAKSGYVRAIHSLGLLLVNHPELREKGDDPVALLLAAAGAGTWRSSATLGILASQGKLMPKEDKAAYQWFLVARMQGGQDALAGLSAALEHARQALSEEDRARTETAASEWVHAHAGVKVYDVNGLDKKFFPMDGVVTASNM